MSRYNDIVPVQIAPGRAQLALLLLFSCLSLARAQADQQTADVPDGAVVLVHIESGLVDVRTGEPRIVTADSNVPLLVRRRKVDLQNAVPIFSAAVGPSPSALRLPDETFVLPSTAVGPRQAILVRGAGGVTRISIPQNTALLVVMMQRGRVWLHGFRNGAFIVRIRAGQAHLENSGGVGFVQVLRGGVYAKDSAFDRLRVRTATDNIVLERCSAKQIEATTINGSIVYDNGTFEPGLARFQSNSGDIAIGVRAGGVQIGARSGVRRVFSNFGRSAQITNRFAETQVSLGGGGPVVTALSNTGSVYLYDGSLRTRARLPIEWHAARGALQRSRPARRRP